MSSVKCKTGNMAVRDYCLLWGCPGMVILTISLFVSLKVGNDFGQDNFAKFVTFVISSGLLGTVYYLFQSVLADVPLKLQKRPRKETMLLNDQESEVIPEDLTDNVSLEQIQEFLAEMPHQTETPQVPLSEEMKEPIVEVSDTTKTSIEQPDLYALRCKEFQREQEQ